MHHALEPLARSTVDRSSLVSCDSPSSAVGARLPLIARTAFIDATLAESANHGDVAPIEVQERGIGSMR